MQNQLANWFKKLANFQRMCRLLPRNKSFVQAGKDADLTVMRTVVSQNFVI